LDTDEVNQVHYTIKCNIPENRLKGFKNHISEITNLKTYLSKALNPSECKRVKQLQKPISYLFEAHIGHQGLRLTFTINDDTHKIFIEDINTRTRAFNP
jgi:mRNA-degrading endonuclease RelE of RelBE toxin-antitoxin system